MANRKLGHLADLGVATRGRDLRPAIDAVKSRARTLTQLAHRVAVRLDPSRAALEPKGEALITKMGAAYRENLRHALAVLGPIPEAEWRADRILEAVKAGAEAGGIKLGDVMQPIRVALTGDTVSEPVNELLAVVGKAVALARLELVAGRA